MPELVGPAYKATTVTVDSPLSALEPRDNESVILSELLAHPQYTFLMNRPLGLIKGKKKRLFLPTAANYLHCFCVYD